MPDDLEHSDDVDQTPTPATESPVIKDLRKDRDTAMADAEAAKRELTLHKAGLGDLSEKQMKALSAAHEGDWTPDLLKETANELGFGQPTNSEQTPPEPRIPAAELAAHQRVADASGGQPTPPPDDLGAAIDATNSPEELHAVLANAGMLLDDG